MDQTRRHARRSIAPLAALGLALVALIGLAGSSLAVVPADYSNVVVGLQPFMTGLDGPVLVTNAGDGSRRLFVVEQRGVIKVWRSGHALSTFLDMRSKVESSSEQGLLALAFHPDYEHNRKFYVLFTEKGTGDVDRGRVQGQHGRPEQGLELVVPAAPPDRPPRQHEPQRRDARLRQEERLPLHLGRRRRWRRRHARTTPRTSVPALGKLAPDRRQRAQTGLAYRIPPNNPWAKSKTAKREIWSYGLRNPWRFSFDRLTGDTWIGDVGQGAWEEVDKAAIAGSGGRGGQLRLAHHGGQRLLPAVLGLPHDRAFSCRSPSTTTAPAARSSAATSTAGP